MERGRRNGRYGQRKEICDKVVRSREGLTRLLPRPLDVVNAAHRRVRKLIEDFWREIKVRLLTASAPVGNGNNDLLSLVFDKDILVAHRVKVRVDAIVTWEFVKDDFADCSNHVRVSVGNSTCT